jgi:ankyrin repeat protein
VKENAEPFNHDFVFEYLLNKRRKYDGNTLVHLAVKFEKHDVVEYLISNQERWKFDFKNKNKDGHAILHLAVLQKDIPLFNLISKYQN